ncbi:BofC C-terminal domain-containing protein [Paenibacillus sp. WST5]|uniref:BofC C-terminal domain-containing protein n=2 Tax=Paenibacillus sedimenti TaxID=2770274 RepID=A0A926QJN2_9BACL|nr:BofC C-terminal domain-containing protein [Paenibacillus sedimenti]
MFIAVCTIGWGLHVTGHLPGAVTSLERASKATFGKLTPEENQRFKDAISTLKGITDSRQTYLLKSYLCGEERQELGIQTPNQLLQEQMKHPGWMLSLGAKGEVTFTEEIEDLSPQCKQKAVFGIDAGGNLSLFNGAPGKDNVIRTFFQLNIKHLESSLPVETVKQLHKGIRISDLDEYYSVLSTFSDYAVEETERAMTRP